MGRNTLCAGAHRDWTARCTTPGMLNLGHSHPDFIYANDQKQAKLVLFLSALAAVLISALIIYTVLAKNSP